ncbi:iron-containing alcohol dehydrogenase [Ignisphaera aggregans DSM 17230]|uniref:Iron-containing alcohol dehydrogenase n=1 Tax=Ignisphaera aggregans (strain DSM 17230 / JCM 13409 / AQ1.S1) TaxID=583356 RepID=E0SR77_IGNAA|nr:iron-containing alcohol dehydrogenase [Ignisphaera aggregans DSM 17230]
MNNLQKKDFTLRYASTSLYFGVNAIDKVKDSIKHYSRALIAMGKTSGRVSGAFSDVEKVLKDIGISYIVYDKVTPNPWASQAEELAQIVWSEGVDLIIAIGGGSPIDVAKVASVIALSGGRVKDYVTGTRKPIRALPLLAINLTHGTGTEVDRYAVVTLDDSREKHGLSIKYPEISIDDPRYTITLDKKQTIYTSLDAFYHSYEAITSTVSNPFIETMAKESISIIASDLQKLVNDLRNLDLRTNMMYAAMLAGIAIDMGSTHINHAIEHVLSGLEPKLPHACGLALTGPRMVYYVHKAVPELSAKALRFLDPEIKPLSTYAEKAQEAVREFQRSIGFEERLSDYGFTDKDLDKIIEYLFKRLKYMYSNTPFEVTMDIVKDIVKYAL